MSGYCSSRIAFESRDLIDNMQVFTSLFLRTRWEVLKPLQFLFLMYCGLAHGNRDFIANLWRLISALCDLNFCFFNSEQILNQKYFFSNPFGPTYGSKKQFEYLPWPSWFTSVLFPIHTQLCYIRSSFLLEFRSITMILLICCS